MICLSLLSVSLFLLIISCSYQCGDVGPGTLIPLWCVCVFQASLLVPETKEGTEPYMLALCDSWSDQNDRSMTNRWVAHTGWISQTKGCFTSGVHRAAQGEILSHTQSDA